MLLETAGKSIEEGGKAKVVLDSYFKSLKAFAKSRTLPSRIRFLCSNLCDMRANQWVPRRKELTAKTIDQIHAEAEANLGLRKGAAGLRASLAASKRRRV